MAAAMIHRVEGRDRPTLATERGQWRLLLALIVLTGAAWFLRIAHGQSMSMPTSGVAPEKVSHHLRDLGITAAAHLAASGMAGAGWSSPGFSAFVVAWAVMMAAMMFRGLAPMLLTGHAVAHHQRGSHGGVLSTSVFVSGYVVVWTAVGCLL
jgi:predicted metal-binding membrane protein